ncbi:MAG TPA: TIGR01212 family radical SAM protein [Spirochaetia bacterium]|nr:TIGR01212 family radical SAM protein [Spirochaetia bacterium]
MRRNCRGQLPGLSTCSTLCYARFGTFLVAEPPYLSYSRYLRQRHGCTVYRVAVDAGFSCPNRNNGRSSSGCSYCAVEGSRAPYLHARGADVPGCDLAGIAPGSRESLSSQVSKGISFLSKRYSAEAFILFFQAYSNTNAPVAELERIYDTGLSLAPFCGLNVATRPDCLDEEKARLLASYRERGLEVWVELGLQTANDETLRRIRRGHTFRDFARAVEMSKQNGLKVGVHLIFGLPGESRDDIMSTVRLVSGLADGVKIHNLLIPRGTLLARELIAGEVTTPGPWRHLEYTLGAIERLPEETVIMRITCDALPADVLSPKTFWSKPDFTARLTAEMNARGARQGRLFGTDGP